MSLAQIKEQILLLVHQVENPDTIMRLYHELAASFKAENGHDFWDELTATQKQDIETARNQVKTGKTVSDDSIREVSRQWLTE